MVDAAVQQSTAKGAASAAEMATRPFQCDWHEGCSKSFNRKSDLQRHYRIHTNERPYACDYKPCSKTFIQRSALTVHRRTHTGDKPHKCPFMSCGKCFSDSSSLARHRRIHTNDKPYICRNQRCKKAFCRKTTMTKHIRKEHPAESNNDDQDAEYSDVEASDEEALDDESDEIKEEPCNLYPESKESQMMHSGRPTNEYSRNLWSLPGQSIQRPSPLRLQGSALLRSEAPVHEIKLERTSSPIAQRSMTDPYPNGSMDTSDYSLSRVSTMPDDIDIPSSMHHRHIRGPMTQHYRLRNTDNNIDLWSPQHALQHSPTSLTHSSPSSASTQSHPMFTSQPIQLQQVGLPSHEQMQYQHEIPVHEIHLDQPQQQLHRDMAPTPIHQNPFDGGIRPISHLDSCIAMSREVSQFQDDLPPTPAPNQQLPHYTTSLAETPYQTPQYLALDTFSSNNQVFPPNGGVYQYNEASSDWWKAPKLEADGWILPSQRMQEFAWGS